MTKPIYWFDHFNTVLNMSNQSIGLTCLILYKHVKPIYWFDHFNTVLNTKPIYCLTF